MEADTTTNRKEDLHPHRAPHHHSRVDHQAGGTLPRPRMDPYLEDLPMDLLARLLSPAAPDTAASPAALHQAHRTVPLQVVHTEARPSSLEAPRKVRLMADTDRRHLEAMVHQGGETFLCAMYSQYRVSFMYMSSLRPRSVSESTQTSVRIPVVLM